MPVVFLDTQPSIVPVTIEIPFSIFSSASQSVTIATTGVGPGQIPSVARLMDVIVHKETAFDANTVEIGHAATAGLRDTIATSSEVAATTKGVIRPLNWMLTDKFGDLLTTANRPIHARNGAGALATVGLIRLTLMLAFLTPRATL